MAPISTIGNPLHRALVCKTLAAKGTAVRSLEAYKASGRWGSLSALQQAKHESKLASAVLSCAYLQTQLTGTVDETLVAKGIAASHHSAELFLIDRTPYGSFRAGDRLLKGGNFAYELKLFGEAAKLYRKAAVAFSGGEPTRAVADTVSSKGLVFAIHPFRIERAFARYMEGKAFNALWAVNIGDAAAELEWYFKNAWKAAGEELDSISTLIKEELAEIKKEVEGRDYPIPRPLRILRILMNPLGSVFRWYKKRCLQRLLHKSAAIGVSVQIELARHFAITNSFVPPPV